MSGPLVISDRALRTFVEESLLPKGGKPLLRAAEIIVAEELRQLAIHSREGIGGSFCREDHDLLLRRADELDPPEATS